jgi:hypothetical protein
MSPTWRVDAAAAGIAILGASAFLEVLNRLVGVPLPLRGT